MLTNEEMEKIKTEEIYRDEIRKKINGSEVVSFGKKSWRFVNSSFGIWLLSTVIVGSIVYFYNSNKLQNEISANNAATIQKLETESSNRLQQFKSALANQKPSELYYQKDQLAYMIDGILFNNGSYGEKKPIYIFPEYKERTMNSLLYEIGRLKSDKNELSTIRQAAIIINGIQSSLLKIEDPPRLDFALSQIIQQKAQIGQALSPDEQKQLTDYELRNKIFEEGELTKYHTKTKKEVEELIILFDTNSYLKDLTEK